MMTIVTATPTGLPLITKYRPQSFNQVIGQDLVVKSLAQLAASPSRPHLYLFTGPSGCGKTTLAKILAASFGCKGIDVLEIDAATTGDIDTIRSLTDQMGYAPLTGAGKMLIMDECHVLSSKGWQALLKSTEETTEFGYYVFCTTEDGKVPSTLKTRASEFKLKRVPVNLLAAYAKVVAQWETDAGFPITLNDDCLMAIAEAADGSVRKTLSILDQCRVANDLTEVRSLAQSAAADYSESDPVIKIIQGLLNEQKSWDYYKTLIPQIEEWGGVRPVMKGYIGKVALGQGGLRMAILLDAIDKMPMFLSPKEGPADLALMIMRVIYK